MLLDVIKYIIVYCIFYFRWYHVNIISLSKKLGADSARWRRFCPVLTNLFLVEVLENSFLIWGKNCASGQNLRHVFYLIYTILRWNHENIKHKLINLCFIHLYHLNYTQFNKYLMYYIINE